MINFDDVVKENIKKHNPNWAHIPDHPYRTLIIGGAGKANSLFSLINQLPDIDKIYLYPKDPCEGKYQFLVNRRESTGLNHFNDSKAFTEYPSNMVDISKNIEDYNSNKKRKTLIIFDDMIADMLSNRKLNPIVTVLFISGRKLNISLDFITQSYFTVPYNKRLNPAHYFIMKTPSKRKLHQITFNHLPDIYLKNFMNRHIKCTAKQYAFLIIDATLL